MGALGELRALVDRLKGRWGPDGFGGREWERLVEVWGKIAAKVGLTTLKPPSPPFYPLFTPLLLLTFSFFSFRLEGG